jgi:hypothetical protein
MNVGVNNKKKFSSMKLSGMYSIALLSTEFANLHVSSDRISKGANIKKNPNLPTDFLMSVFDLYESGIFNSTS